MPTNTNQNVNSLHAENAANAIADTVLILIRIPMLIQILILILIQTLILILTLIQILQGPFGAINPGQIQQLMQQVYQI